MHGITVGPSVEDVRPPAPPRAPWSGEPVTRALRDRADVVRRFHVEPTGVGDVVMGTAQVSEPRPGVAARVVIAMLGFYRRWISPMFLPHCRFHPSCSAYAVEAVRVHGVLRGAALALVRLLKCAPWHPGGPDPVPPRRPRGPDGVPAAGPDRDPPRREDRTAPRGAAAPTSEEQASC